MDIDRSKENIQPLRGGRNPQQLGAALHAQHHADAQRMLDLQKQEHEANIRNYDGPDPLDPWFNYIQWVEQSFPKHGHEGQIDKLIKECLTIFENDDRYKQDRRFLRLWIKYIDCTNDPLEMYRLLHSRGIGTSCSELYRAWACYCEEASDHEKAEEIYNLGLQSNAQPREELEQAHIAFQIFFAQRVLHNDSPTKRKAASALAETRLALTSLRTVKRRNTTTVPSERTGDNIYNVTPGTIKQNVGASTQLPRSNIMFSVYDANPGPSTFSISSAIQNEQTSGVSQPSLIQSTNMVENQKEIGIWTNNSLTKTEKICKKSPTAALLPFTVYEDEGIILSSNHSDRCLDDFSNYKVPLCVPDPPDTSKIPMYNKKEVYKYGENSSIEFSLEEIRAQIYKKTIQSDSKLSTKQFENISTNLTLVEPDNKIINNPFDSDIKTEKIDNENDCQLSNNHSVISPSPNSSCSMLKNEAANDNKVAVLDSTVQCDGSPIIHSEYNLEKIIAQSNSLLNAEDQNQPELNDNNYLSNKNENNPSDNCLISDNYDCNNPYVHNDDLKKNVVDDFNRSLMANINESMTVNTKEVWQDLNLFVDNDYIPHYPQIEALKFDIREDHSMTMAAVQAKSNMCVKEMKDTEIPSENIILTDALLPHNSQKDSDLDISSTQMFSANALIASTPYNNQFKKPQFIDSTKKLNVKKFNIADCTNTIDKTTHTNSKVLNEGSARLDNAGSTNQIGNDGLYPIMETTQEYRSGSSSGSNFTTRNTIFGYTGRENSGLPLSITEKTQEIDVNQETGFNYANYNVCEKKHSDKSNNANSTNKPYSVISENGHLVNTNVSINQSPHIQLQYHTLDHQYHKLPSYNQYGQQRSTNQCYQNSNQQMTSPINNGYHMNYQNTQPCNNYSNSGYQQSLPLNQQIVFVNCDFQNPQPGVQSPNTHVGFQNSLVPTGFQSPNHDFQSSQQAFSNSHNAYSNPQQEFSNLQQSFSNHSHVYHNPSHQHIPSSDFQSPRTNYSNTHQSFYNSSHNFSNIQNSYSQPYEQNSYTIQNNNTNHLPYQNQDNYSNMNQQNYVQNQSYTHSDNQIKSQSVNSFVNVQTNQIQHSNLKNTQHTYSNQHQAHAVNDNYQIHQEYLNDSHSSMCHSQYQSHNSIIIQKSTSQTIQESPSENLHKQAINIQMQNTDSQKHIYQSSASKLRSVRHEVPNVNNTRTLQNHRYSNQYHNYINSYNEPKDNANTPKFSNSPSISHKMHKNLYVSSPEQAQIPPNTDINLSDNSRESALLVPISMQNRNTIQKINEKYRDQSKRQLDFENRTELQSEDSWDSTTKEPSSRVSSGRSRQSIRSYGDYLQMDVDSENSLDCNITFKTNCSNSLTSTQDIDLPANIDFPETIDPFNTELCNSLLQYVKFPNKNHYQGYCEVKCIPKLQQGMTFDHSKYIVDKQLGKGTFGSVFKGICSNSQEAVALKYQKPANPWEYYICQEIKVRIKDQFMLPGYMDIRSAYFGDNASIFVSELSIYGSLLDVANRIRTATSKCIGEFIVMLMASEMISIIHHLHKNKIIHADIKPDNFLVMQIPQTESRAPSLQLIDFGCAIDMTLFPEGTTFKKVISTDGFTCHEMRKGRPWTYQTDLYCLAGTIYVILMGSYMQTTNRGGRWVVEKKWPRYMKSKIWDEIFLTLLNVEDCSSMPDLLKLKSTLDEFLQYETNLSGQLRTFKHVLKCK